MEFLSKQFNTSRGAINLVLQTPESVKHGYDASNTSEFKVKPLDYRPDEQFHEYRFDWSPNKVEFFVDGKSIHSMTDQVPDSAGSLFLNHWSNGDPAWSAGPPNKDVAMTISYVKAYFNSTEQEKKDAYKKRCKKFDVEKVCEIPAQMVAPDAKLGGEQAAKTHFFSLLEGYTPGQETFMKSAANQRWEKIPGVSYLPLVVAIVVAVGWI